MTLVKDKGKSSESISLRLRKSILNELRQEARQKSVNINTLTSQILEEHINWHNLAARAGFIAVNRSLLKKLMEKYAEDEMKEIGRHLSLKSAEDFLLLLRKEYNIASVLHVMETWLKIVGYPYRHVVNDGIHSFVIQHDMGRKWSAYLSSAFQTVFEDLETKDLEFNITDNTVFFTVDVEK